MKKSTRRAFTIVELVIVIAVIAILAAVLIPTFGSIIQQANDARAESELRDIKVKLEMAFAKKNPIVFTNEAYVEIKIHRNSDGTLWSESNTLLPEYDDFEKSRDMYLDEALNDWPELDGYGVFTVEGKDLIYTTKSGAGKATWSNIVGEKQGDPIVDGLEFTPYNNGENFIVTGIGTYVNEKNIVIPSVFQGKPVTGIGDEAFKECESIENISIPISVTSIGDYAFLGCWSLTSINLPESLTTIGEGAFALCSSLTSINLPESLTTIGDGAFIICSSLTSIKLPKNLTSIGESAFLGCSSLTNINLPEGVKSIGECAFYDCSSLTSINLPKSLTHIGDEAFNFCSNLKTITYSGTIAEWNAIGKLDGIWIDANYNFTIYCVDGTIASDGTVTHY